MTSVHTKEPQRRPTDRRRPQEGGGVMQHRPGDSGRHQTLEQAQEIEIAFRAPGGSMAPTGTLISNSALKAMREDGSVFLCQFVVICYSSPSTPIHSLYFVFLSANGHNTYFIGLL